MNRPVAGAAAALGLEVQGLSEALDGEPELTGEALAVGSVGKLLHEPTVRMKDSAGTARGERLAEALRDLFDL